MSRSRAGLRPSVTKLTVKGTLPSINLDKDRVFADSIKGQSLDLSNSQLSASTNRRKSSEKRDNFDHLLKEIEKWRSKFTASQRALEDARSDTRFKTEKIHSLESKIELLESDIKKELQIAKDKAGNHNKCKKEIDSLKGTLNQKEAQIIGLNIEMEDSRRAFQVEIASIEKEKEEQREVYETKIKEEKESLLKEFDEKVAALKENFDKEMNVKDEKLKMLKRQIAEALTGSSLERQQQIEELLKELKRVSDEAETVKAALRSLKLKGNCSKCSIYEKKCMELQEQLKAKEISFNQLMKISWKMEKQISQQDELLVIWNKVKNESKKSPR